MLISCISNFPSIILLERESAIDIFPENFLEIVEISFGTSLKKKCLEVFWAHECLLFHTKNYRNSHENCADKSLPDGVILIYVLVGRII